MVRRFLVLLCLLVPTTASASLIDVSFFGTVTSVTNPAEAQGVVVGDLLSVLFRYDTADLVDVSAVVEDAFGTPPPGILTAATLTGPDNFLSVTLAGRSFTAADDVDFGQGNPPFPLAVFLNGALLGVEFLTSFEENFFLALFPTANLMGVSPAFFGAPLDAEPAFEGTVDVANAVTTQVPEPATVTLLALGFGLLPASRTLRRKLGTNLLNQASR